MKKFCHYISEHIALLVLAASMLALAFPSVLQTIPTKAINYLLGVVMFGLASALAAIHFAAYPMATIPGAIFSVWHNISGATVAWLYTRKRFNKGSANIPTQKV